MISGCDFITLGTFSGMLSYMYMISMLCESLNLRAPMRPMIYQTLIHTPCGTNHQYIDIMNNYSNVFDCNSCPHRALLFGALHDSDMFEFQVSKVTDVRLMYQTAILTHVGPINSVLIW